MNDDYMNAIQNHGASLITHVGLVNDQGDPISDRLSASWTAASNGDIRMSGNLVFDIAAGVTVAGWRGYSAASGGTNYGGYPITPETFTNEGTYTLIGAETGINLGPSS